MRHLFNEKSCLKNHLWGFLCFFFVISSSLICSITQIIEWNVCIFEGEVIKSLAFQNRWYSPRELWTQSEVVSIDTKKLFDFIEKIVISIYRNFIFTTYLWRRGKDEDTTKKDWMGGHFVVYYCTNCTAVIICMESFLWGSQLYLLAAFSFPLSMWSECVKVDHCLCSMFSSFIVRLIFPSFRFIDICILFHYLLLEW